jgi:hypothetical protein
VVATLPTHPRLPQHTHTHTHTGNLKILGLADLGAVNSTNVTYNSCYASDADNYIDICLTGSEDAARRIVALEMPAGNKTADPTGGT